MKPATRTRSHTLPRPGIGYRLMHGMMWPILKVLGLSCRAYAELCSIRLDRPLNFGERLRFRFHGMMCHLCRPIPKHLEHLRTLTRCAACEDSPLPQDTTTPTDVLGEESVERIRQALRAEQSANSP